jgi:uncharacterized protein YgiM (DUF1202 family)
MQGRRPGTARTLARCGPRLAVVLLLAAGSAHAQEAEPARRPPRAASPVVADPAAEAAEPAPPPEPAWVRGELKLNFRASPSPTSTALGIVTTGDQVLVLERKGAWARIRVASGETGWLPESSLLPEAPPVERVAALEGELASVREELAVAQREIETLQRRDEERQTRADERERAFEQIEEENRDLRAGERWPYMVTGASILGAGLTAGFLMRGGASRRGGGRIRF